MRLVTNVMLDEGGQKCSRRIVDLSRGYANQSMAPDFAAKAKQKSVFNRKRNSLPERPETQSGARYITGGPVVFSPHEVPGYDSG